MNIGNDCVGMVRMKELDTDMLRWLTQRYEVIVESKGEDITYELYGYGKSVGRIYTFRFAEYKK